MPNKTIAVSVVLLLAGWVVWSSSQPDSAQMSMPKTVSFNPDSVMWINLESYTMPGVSLFRSEKLWYLAEDVAERGENKRVLADKDAVEHLLNDLAFMEVVRVVTRNPEHYEYLDIGKKSIRLSLKDKDKKLLLDMFIGKQGVDLLSTYVRMASAADVLAVNKALLWQVKRLPQSWKARASMPEKTDATK